MIVGKEERMWMVPLSLLSDRFSSQQQSLFQQLLLMIKSARHQTERRPKTELKESLLDGGTTLDKHYPHI